MTVRIVLGLFLLACVVCSGVALSRNRSPLIFCLFGAATADALVFSLLVAWGMFA